VRQSDCFAAVFQHLVNAACGQPPFCAEPQPRIGSPRMASTDPDVAVKVPGGLRSNREDKLAAALGYDTDDARSQIEVGMIRTVRAVPETGHALKPHAGVHEQP